MVLSPQLMQVLGECQLPRRQHEDSLSWLSYFVRYNSRNEPCYCQSRAPIIYSWRYPCRYGIFQLSFLYQS